MLPLCTNGAIHSHCDTHTHIQMPFDRSYSKNFQSHKICNEMMKIAFYQRNNNRQGIIRCRSFAICVLTVLRRCACVCVCVCFHVPYFYVIFRWKQSGQNVIKITVHFYCATITQNTQYAAVAVRFYAFVMHFWFIEPFLVCSHSLLFVVSQTAFVRCCFYFFFFHLFHAGWWKNSRKTRMKDRNYV